MPRPNSHGLPIGITPWAGKYRARVTYHGRRYQIGCFYTIGDAKAALAIARSQIARETFVPLAQRRQRWREEQEAERAAAMTVRGWSEKWIQGLVKTNRSPGTIASYESTLRTHITPQIGDLLLSEVKPKHIADLVDGVTPGVAYNIASTASALFNAAVKAKAGGLSESPVQITAASYAKRLRRPQGADDASPRDIWSIADAMPAYLSLAPRISALCATRLGETLGLQRSDVELDTESGNWLRIERQWASKAKPHPAFMPPKVGSIGTVAIPDLLVPHLRRQLATFVADDPQAPLFPSPANKMRPVAQSTFDRIWREARDQIAPDLHYHSLRHIALTEFNRAGATPAETLHRGRQGGSDTSIYGRYQNASRKRDQEITAVMNAMWTKALDTE